MTYDAQIERRTATASILREKLGEALSGMDGPLEGQCGEEEETGSRLVGSRHKND